MSSQLLPSPGGGGGGGGGGGQRDPELLLLTICLGSVAGVKRGKSDWKEVGVGGVANLIPRN